MNSLPSTNCSTITVELKLKAKFIYLSTGLSSYKEIAKILNRINLKKIILIHTSFDEKLKNINFNRIKELRARFNVPVAYGNHSKFLSSIYKSISFKPHAIFFYVKLNRNYNTSEKVISLTTSTKIKKLLRAVILEKNTLKEIFEASKSIKDFSILSPISSDTKNKNYGYFKNKIKAIISIIYSLYNIL